MLDEVYNARLTDFGLTRDIGEETLHNTDTIGAKTTAYRPKWATENTISTDLDVFALCVGEL